MFSMLAVVRALIIMVTFLRISDLYVYKIGLYLKPKFVH
jgi:hypothetical protein